MRGNRNSSDEDTSDDINAILGRDWAGDALTKIDNLVDGVHDKAVLPLVTAIRAFVFGIIIALMAFTILVLLVLASVRIINNYATDHRVWLTYAIMGGVFMLVGLVLWFKRKTKEA